MISQPGLVWASMAEMVRARMSQRFLVGMTTETSVASNPDVLDTLSHLQTVGRSTEARPQGHYSKGRPAGTPWIVKLPDGSPGSSRAGALAGWTSYLRTR